MATSKPGPVCTIYTCDSRSEMPTASCRCWLGYLPDQVRPDAYPQPQDKPGGIRCASNISRIYDLTQYARSQRLSMKRREKERLTRCFYRECNTNTTQSFLNPRVDAYLDYAVCCKTGANRSSSGSLRLHACRISIPSSRFELCRAGQIATFPPHIRETHTKCKDFAKT